MLHTFLKRFFPVNYTLLHTRKHFVIVLLCKAFPVLEEKIGKCADFKRYFDFYVVFEIFRGVIDPDKTRSYIISQVNLTRGKEILEQLSRPRFLPRLKRLKIAPFLSCCLASSGEKPMFFWASQNKTKCGPKLRVKGKNLFQIQVISNTIQLKLTWKNE